MAKSASPGAERFDGTRAGRRQTCLATSALAALRANEFAYAINDAGTTVGTADKIVGDVRLGTRAVRWAAGATEATELGSLGTNAAGQTDSEARAINASGVAVGVADSFSGTGTIPRTRAVRWDATGTAATELGLPTTDTRETFAFDINDAGITVGYATTGPIGFTRRALIWNAEGAATDLNALVGPTSGWVLNEATASAIRTGSPASARSTPMVPARCSRRRGRSLCRCRNRRHSSPSRVQRALA